MRSRGGTLHKPQCDKDPDSVLKWDSAVKETRQLEKLHYQVGQVQKTWRPALSRLKISTN